MSDAGRDESRVCPASHAGWLSTPLRKLVHPPGRMLGGLVAPGDRAVDLGCGPGFFTLPLAKMVGEGGRVTAVDLQSEMLERLRSRARRAGLESRIETRRCDDDTLGLGGPYDFALAFYMVHEAPDAGRLLAEVSAALRPGARLLLVEPSGHVDEAAFAATVEGARAAGFRPLRAPRIAFSRVALLERE